MLTYLNDFTIKKGAVYLLFDTFREFCDSKVGFSCIFLKNKRGQRGSCRTARPDRILGEGHARRGYGRTACLTGSRVKRGSGRTAHPTGAWPKYNTQRNPGRNAIQEGMPHTSKQTSRETSRPILGATVPLERRVSDRPPKHHQLALRMRGEPIRLTYSITCFQRFQGMQELSGPKTPQRSRNGATMRTMNSVSGRGEIPHWR